MSFVWPWVFLLTPLPLVLRYILPRARAHSAALRTPFSRRARAAAEQKASHTHAFRVVPWVLLVSAWLSLIVAAARPQILGDTVSLSASGRDLMLAVDISGSMSTADMVVENQQIARIVIVKYLLGEFLQKREGDRVGLILFGTQAYLQAPLTFDLATVDQLLQEAQLRMAGEKTAIGDAIGLAVKRLKDRPSDQRVLILLTDGENTAGNVDPRQAADLAAQAGVKIYTIGMGANSMEVSAGMFGTFTRSVNPSAELDEESLRYIAETTGGQYYRAHDPKELQDVYTQLDQQEAIEHDDEQLRPTRDVFYYPLALSLALLFALLALSTRLPLQHSGDA